MDTTRRSLLAAGSLALLPGVASTSLARSLAAQSAAGGRGRTDPALRLATLTDIHYADADPRGNRHYRDSIPKVAEAVRAITEADEVSPIAICVQLGDLIDSRNTPIEEGAVEEELAYLATIEARLADLPCERHYVFGNHCVHTLTKDEFAEHSAAQRSFYSFDRPFTSGTGSLHVVVLDACYRADGQHYGRRNFDWTDANIPAQELAWLEADLAAAASPTVICTHQRLDGDDATTIRNAPAVREVIQRAGNVLAVLQGHHHQNTLSIIEGVPYLVMRAVVEGPGMDNRAFGLVDIHPDLSLNIHGFGQQSSYAATQLTAVTPEG